MFLLLCADDPWPSTFGLAEQVWKNPTCPCNPQSAKIVAERYVTVRR